MEITVKNVCGVCHGDLVVFRHISDPGPGAGLVLSEVPCICTETPTPGFVVIGTADISDLADAVNDVMDKCNDIFEKVNE